MDNNVHAERYKFDTQLIQICYSKTNPECRLSNKLLKVQHKKIQLKKVISFLFPVPHRTLKAKHLIKSKLSEKKSKFNIPV